MSTPKTGAALREEIEATLHAAHEQRVDLDALADNVEVKLKERDASLSNCTRHHGNGEATAWVSLVIGGFMFIVGAFLGTFAVSGGAPAHSVQPYRQAYFSQLRYDARTICAAAAAQDAEQPDLQDWSAWQSAVNAYIGDQRILENARHIIAPNYQDMANVVCPST